MRYLLAVISFVGLLAQPVLAQDRPNTILVLDGSGSMWGQIDTLAKITIAQDVVTGLLSTIPPEQQLGLAVYGHRTRGDCTDIEVIVTPGPDTRAAIGDAVRAIKPLGKTPMTDAVIAAAEALRYTEEKATVILVSDGIETCNPDPCAAARLLEEAGIDFTAHVIGFDVTDAEALAQMQCLAEETGGTFLTAANADELTAALTTVAATPEPEPVPVPALLRAVEGDADAPLLDDPVLWTVTGPDGTAVTTDQQANPLELDLLPGAYQIIAYRVQAEAEKEAQLQVVAGADATLTVVFEKPAVTATLDAAETAAMGDTIPVTWNGPDSESDYIGVGDPQADSDRPVTYSYVRDGNPVELQMPPSEGAYELRYYQKDGTIIGTRPITVTPVAATLDASETAAAGSTLDVAWNGPDYKNDFIAIGAPGETYINYTYTREGMPAPLVMPTEPGTYELRYVMNQDRTVLVTRKIDVVEVMASVTPPSEAVAGAVVPVPWQGPDYKNDFIAVGKPGEKYTSYEYTRNGTPAQLRMPTEPGDYEVRYVLNQDREVIATAMITLTDVAASVSPPSEAVAGAVVPVPWQGPDYKNDFIAVGKPGENYTSYEYTRNGTPAQLRMPTEPGDYEVRYVLNQDREVIATAMITLEAVEAQLTAPQDARVGATLPVPWEGPDYKNDFIAIGAPGEKYTGYTYTRDGSPAQVRMPSLPGTYELRYVLDQGRRVIATLPVTVSDITVTLNAPINGQAGTTVAIPFDGPGYARDYIGIGAPGSDDYVTYVYAKKGEVAQLKLPDVPGAYELFYVMDADRRVMARQPFTVTP
ncbi:vWA domain-containing protein [Pseudosulfitobacter koreensis]|uniref:VWA domain-containing protein n=1 Tax=Pseudosulfitobacter koreensis TaxID=2968472 RepID=A0ABT1YXM6_9RHOB|nr:VWA domain-containing protein [Pseudosulfitobacter koreense]MCR8825644.1 VWA domain-containing protein [Pseudosulfitobacter koreense]